MTPKEFERLNRIGAVKVLAEKKAEASTEEDITEPPIKRKRGRPPKNKMISEPPQDKAVL